jgi:DNA (cytosine-5)-methyltransferase 1
MTYKLGSLFDGSGGFPLSGALCGIEPAWAAEVEPYPIAVTRSRFPNMRHLGDISKVNGADIEPVDIITFGSPCQDLSVAGKRAGLKHEANGDEETTRSGLFMEAVRIIKEMRSATNGEYPRFALWENVPGAFSSNKGEDFRIVCEELIKIVEPSAVMPAVPQKGWAYSDSYIGNGWSLAYRVFDAQYWGVPQRRRRIHLVVDFRGECAREVLFERQGVRGYFETSRTPWQDLAPNAEGGIGADDSEGESAGGAGGRQLDAVAYTLKVRSGCDVDSAGKAAGKGALVQTEKAATLACVQDQYLFQPTAYSFDSLASNSMKSKNPHSGCREVEVAKTLDTTDPNPSKNQGGIAIVEPTAIIDNIGGQAEYGKVSLVNGTLRSAAQGAVAYVVENHPADSRVNLDETGKVQTLTSRMGTGGGNVPMVMEPMVCLEGNGSRPSHQGDGYSQTDKMYTLNTIERHGVAYAVDQGGGKSACNVTEESAPTLTCTHGGAPAVAYGIDQGATRDVGKLFLEEQSKTLTNGTCPGHHNGVVVAYGLDRASFNQGQNAQFGFSVDEDLSPTIIAKGPGGVAYSLDEKMGQTYVWAEQANTLAARDYKQPQAVAFQSYQDVTGPLMANSHPGSYTGQDAFSDMLVAGKEPTCVADHPTPKVDEKGRAFTLSARDYKNPQALAYPSGEIRYIVRRLTPTECARLQGFADWHGHLEQKTDLTDEEHSFWMDVRNTHAAINGKAVKDYTKAQMLTWYNKLWTDAAEYKMWGNGIALPPALYCMQGIMDVLNREEDDAWLL